MESRHPSSLGAAPLFVCALSASQLAHAAGAGEGAGAPTVLTLVQMLAALVIVLGAIWLFAWVLRRMAPRNVAGGALKVLGGVMVGPRERLVLIEVADTWLIVGVGANAVNLVHTMTKPDASANGQQPAAVATLVARALRSHEERG